MLRSLSHKLLWIVTLLSALLATACDPVDPDNPVPGPDPVPVPVTPVAVESVSISSTSVELTVGDAHQLTATVSPSNATYKNVSWSSSDQSVATVSQAGLVTAVSQGSTTIKAMADGKAASCAVTVKPATVPVTGITLDKTSITLLEGKSETIVATVTPDNATDKTIVWSSSDPAIASVDDGEVLAIAKGTATISAKAGDFTATCTVTVKKDGFESGDPEGFNNKNEQWERISF